MRKRSADMKMDMCEWERGKGERDVPLIYPHFDFS